MRQLAEQVEAHVRLEERRLFPLIQELVPQEELAEPASSPATRNGGRRPARGQMGSGPALGHGDRRPQRDAVLAWPPGGGTDEHVNDERDVLVVVSAGSATVTLDGEPHGVGAGRALVVESWRRRIDAGPAGVRYLSVSPAARRPRSPPAHRPRRPVDQGIPDAMGARMRDHLPRNPREEENAMTAATELVNELERAGFDFDVIEHG